MSKLLWPLIEVPRGELWSLKNSKALAVILKKDIDKARSGYKVVTLEPTAEELALWQAWLAKLKESRKPSHAVVDVDIEEVCKSVKWHLLSAIEKLVELTPGLKWFEAEELVHQAFERTAIIKD